MVENIHYYCSSAVFLSIIEKQELWLTSLSQSNDHLEGTWMLHYWLRKFDRSSNPAHWLKKRGARIAVETVLRHNVALGICFSEDSDLLSQWRGYAADGTGFSVAFDRVRLEEFVSEHQGGFSPSLSKIFYGYQDIEEINKVIRKLADAFDEDAEKYQESSDGIGTMNLVFTKEKHQRQRDAARSLFTIKNGAFSEEKEWRLFAFDSISKIGDVRFRDDRGVLSPFIRLKIPMELIRGVTLGPSNKTPISMIESALKVYGVECPVFTSTASYRGS